ncbi:hypothetical protein AALP_AA4G253200 [Arabis alpina]|uniref:Ion transport domain-containing protein n=1 Tax=Arabis alpina TaxID=50452 RepID=A0A087H5K8_ARAAL|nr:hypothetical protein AALP_AA4G253200 [Arabis alpina]
MQFVDGNFSNVRCRLRKVYRKMKTLENWRKIVLFVCVAALAIDPLFFFVPVIDPHRFCLTFDMNLGVAVCVLRTFIDTFYVFHIVYYLITELIVPRSQVSLRGEILVHSEAIRKRRFLFYFIVDVLSVLPIPQVVVLLTLISRKQQYSAWLVTKQMLLWVIICQNIPRIIRFYPLFKEVTRASGTIAETKWIGAALNFSLYMLQSHAFGAFWYLGATEKKHKCWREACAKTLGCNLTNVYCVRDSMDFPRKFFYCFWWGLRNLSALGQNLETSNSIGEIFFAIIICISGLLLFAVLIGNVQKYLQATTIRVDEMEEKKRDTEKWMSNRMLPKDLKKRIRRYKNKKWRETRGTEEDAHLRSLPKGLILETKRYLYLDFIKKVPEFQALDDRLLDELCARLKTVVYTENSYVVHEADDLKFVSTQYRRLHGKKVQQMYRYYSVKWQTWAACYIQAAWNRYCRRKISKALREEVGKLQNTLENDDSRGNKLNLGAAIYTMRFASNALKNLRANAAERNSRFPQMLSLLPQKPADPEFPMDET